MKLNKILLPVLACYLSAGAARAQVDLTITGSTAFRSIAIDRAQALFDPGFTTKGTPSGGAPGGTLSGTISNVFHSSTPVVVRLSFSGSVAGMQTVDAATLIATVDPVTGNTSNRAPDLAFSDVFPGSAVPAISDSDFDQAIVGVIPFVFVINNQAGSSTAGITNITREQAVLLQSDSGVIAGFNGMPGTFLGGSSTNPVYYTGRDTGSGTRVTTEADTGFTGTPTFWITNAPSTTLFSTNEGFSSGGNERNIIANYTNTIGVLGLADANTIAANSKPIAYEGIPFSIVGVQNGSYPFWGYEHLVNRTGTALSTQQKNVRDALIAGITNQTYQTQNALYTNAFVDQVNMKVKRGADGATIRGISF